MIKAIFLMHEGVPATIFESQVLAHVRRMRGHGYGFEIWTFSLSRENHARSLAVLSQLGPIDVRIRLFKGAPRHIPGSLLIDAIHLFRALRTEMPDAALIHARTEYSSAVAGLIKPLFDFRLVWDARGDTEAETISFHMAAGPLHGLRKRYHRLAINSALRVASCSSDAALFVSDALRKRQGQWLPADAGAVVPCAADSDLFFFSAELRARVRSALGFRSEDVVLMYSGSTAPWQCLTESAALFRQLLAMDPDHIKWIVLTKQPDEVKSLLADIAPGLVWVHSPSLREVNGFLNAADFGMLIRKSHLVNQVASPVKFAEYSLAGLPVIMADTVEQSAAYAHSLDTLIRYEEDTPPPRLVPFSNEARTARARAALPLLSRQAMDEHYSAAYGDKSIVRPSSYPYASRLAHDTGISKANLIQAFKIEKDFHDAILQEQDLHKRRDLYKAVYANVHRLYGKMCTDITLPDNPKAKTVRLFKRELRGRSVLDVGCGSGHFLAAIASNLNHDQLIGIDTSIPARSYEHRSIRFIATDIVEFSVPDPVDVVFSEHVLEHLAPADLGTHLRSIRNCLRPNGLFILIMPNRLFGPSDITRMVDYTYSGRTQAQGTHVNEMSYGDLLPVLAASGFSGFRTVLPFPLNRLFPDVRLKPDLLVWLERNHRWMELLRSIRFRRQCILRYDVIIICSAMAGQGTDSAQAAVR